jgi:hypothetical protein
LTAGIGRLIPSTETPPSSMPIAAIAATLPRAERVADADDARAGLAAIASMS